MRDPLASQLTVYSLKVGIRLLLGFLYPVLAATGGVLLMLLVGVVQAHTWNALSGWLSGTGLTALFAFGIVPLWRTRLELSSEGVAYINPGVCRIYTPWENIEQISRVSRFRTSIVFLLRTPATSTVSFLEGKQHHLAVIERCSPLITKAELLRQASCIDVRAVITKKDLEHGTFAAYFQHYAPISPLRADSSRLSEKR